MRDNTTIHQYIRLPDSQKPTVIYKHIILMRDPGAKPCHLDLLRYSDASDCRDGGNLTEVASLRDSRLRGNDKENAGMTQKTRLFQYFSQYSHDLVDLLFLDNQRRQHANDIGAGRQSNDSVLE